MRLEGQERWTLTLTYAAVLVISIYLVFDRFMSIPWPPTLLGQLIPGAEVHPLGLGTVNSWLPGVNRWLPGAGALLASGWQTGTNL